MKVDNHQDDQLNELLQLNPSSSPVLHEYGTHLLMGEINTDSVRETIEWILNANFDNDHKFKHLNLIINSPGGTFDDGFALIDIMQGSKIPIRTIGIGSVASMGLLIFVAGERGNRILTPNSLIMSHQWSGIIGGKEHELVAHQREHSLITSMVVRHLRRYTGLRENKIRRYLLPPSDVWLDAYQAKELGLCDMVKNV
jgi:ATP-dependent Clp protease protease subunit